MVSAPEHTAVCASTTRGCQGSGTAPGKDPRPGRKGIILHGARGSQKHNSLFWGSPPPPQRKIRHFSRGEQALFHLKKKKAEFFPAVNYSLLQYHQGKERGKWEMMIKKALNPGQDGPAGSCPVPAQGTLSMMWLGGAGLCQPLPPPPPPPGQKSFPEKGQSHPASGLA